MRRALLLAAFSLSACIDGGSRTYTDARTEYAHLVEQNKFPQDPAFDAVLAKLKTVPEDSSRFEEAQALKAAIEAGRVRVRPPLAIVAPANTNLSPEVVAQLQACARLAQLAGRDGGVDERMLKALDECRARAEKLDVHANENP